MPIGKRNAVQKSYDLVADEYARRIYDELEQKPLDRKLLDRFINALPKTALVCDIGTGPGHIARYMHDRGVHVCGIDLSDAMVARAQQLNPGIEFRRGNMLALDVPDETFTAITGFYAFANLPREEIVRALRELRRVLKTGGRLFIAFHIGDHRHHRTEWWGAEVSLYFYFFKPEEMSAYLKAAGFEIEATLDRDPYPEIEQQTRRAYIFARKRAAARLPNGTSPAPAAFIQGEFSF